MSYLAFYREFRPTTFDDVVSQEHIVKTLKNRIAANKIGHAYLFCGPHGTGKTTLAKIFARAINCENPKDGSPCGVCPTCRALAESGNLDISEIDAASNNGVDEMRDLRDKVQYPPVAGRYKVYIIDEVHMLSVSAFNAILKTLEEPPAHAVFILATTEPQKIPATILSRCMRFDFKLIPQSDLENLIKKVFKATGKEYEDAAVSAIARAGAGAARDCLSIADMCASYSLNKLTYDDVSAVLGNTDFQTIANLAKYIFEEESATALALLEESLDTGKSAGLILKDLISFAGNCAIAKMSKNAREALKLPDEHFALVSDIASRTDGHKILRVTEILSKAELDMRYALNGRITLETAVIKCSMPQADYNVDGLIGKIAALEEKLKNAQTIQKPSQKTAASKGIPTAVPFAAEEKKPQPQTEIRSQSEETGRALAEKMRARLIEEKPADFNRENPFSANSAAVQNNLWDAESFPVKHSGNLSEQEKDNVFGKLMKALRTTRRNAVIFTLCMDLGSFFEGGKLILTTDSEAVYKGLTRADNAAYLTDTLTELGVLEYEVRLIQKGESEMEKALKELKSNFNGTDIDIK